MSALVVRTTATSPAGYRAAVDGCAVGDIGCLSYALQHDGAGPGFGWLVGVPGNRGRVDAGASGSAVVIGKSDLRAEMPPSRGVEDELVIDVVEHELGPSKHFERAGVIDIAPREVDESLAAFAVDRRPAGPRKSSWPSLSMVVSISSSQRASVASARTRCLGSVRVCTPTWTLSSGVPAGSQNVRPGRSVPTRTSLMSTSLAR